MVDPAVHLSLALAQSVVAWADIPVHQGRIKEDDSREAFKRFSEAVLSYLPLGLTFSFRLDLAARRTGPTTFIGSHPCTITIDDDGTMDMRSLMEEVGRMPDLGDDDTNALTNAYAHHGQPFKAAFFQLVAAAYSSKEDMFMVFVGQLLMAVTAAVEAKFLTRLPPLELTGQRRQTRRFASDVSNTAAEHVMMYDAKNSRHTRREIERLLRAQQRLFKTCQYLSLSGPDASKIGTDSNVFIAAAMDGSTGLTTWAMPQVACPSLFH